MVFDVDHAAATLSWDDVGAPAPNITVTNKANGHAHLIYGLDTPIRTAPDGNAALCGMPPPSRPRSGRN
ncbi:replication initiation protein [Klebsiella pneumoniae]|uniref:replication initiation protein n=1 Tax=Klebsiella pneumoniae TaxID=573 RepID=UPI001E584A35|nr:replication initiation protein [Klebsiella pneumoniae]